jgi:hypothetical protein
VLDGGQVVDLNIFSSGDRDAMLSPPWQRHKSPWDALGENACGTLLPRASPDQRPPFGRCSYGVRSNSKIEVCVKISGVVVGRMKVVKSIKMKPPKIAPLEMLLLRHVLRTLRRVELSSCKSLRKSELHHP